MKSKLLALGFALVLSALVISGCKGDAATPTESPTTAPTRVVLAPTDTRRPTEPPTGEPTSTARPTEAPAVAPTEAAVEPGKAIEAEIPDWKTYTNERYGYSLRYPPDCTFGPMPEGCKEKPPEERPLECLCFLDTEDPDRVGLQAFTGDKEDLKGAAFWVTRLAADPPPGADLIEYIRERVHYEEIPDEPNAMVGGIPAVRFYTPRSPQAFSQEEIYFIKDDKVLKIYMIDVDEPANRELYDRVSSAMDILVERPEVAEEPVDGWMGTIVKLAPGSQFGDYFEREDGQRFGIDAADDTLRAQLQDTRWTGARLQVWGQLRTDVPAYGGRNIQVERLVVASGPAQEPRNLSPFAFACASSALPTDQWSQYWAWSAIDGSLETTWAEAGRLGHEPEPSGPGIGEWIMLVFPDTIEVQRIGVDVGFDESANYFAKNNRVKRATVIFSKGDFVELTFDDVRGVQMRDIPPVRTTYVRLVIDDVYPGSKYDDTCISEIEVWATTP